MSRSSNRNVKRALRYIASVLLIILIIGLSVSAVAVGTLHYRVVDSELYISAALNDEFYDSVEADIRSCFEENTSVIEIDAEKAFQSIDRASLKKYVDRYVTRFISELFSDNGDKYYEKYDSAELYNFIESTLIQNEEEIVAQGETVDSLSKQAYKAIIGDINVALNFIPDSIFSLVQDALNSKIGSFTSGKYEMHDIYEIIDGLGSVFVSLLIVDFIMCGIFIVINHRKYHKAAVILGFSVFFSTFLVFVPCVILKEFDIANRICIDESPLRYLFMNIFHTAENSLISGTLFALIIGLIILLGGIAVYFSRIYRKNSRIDYNAALRREKEEMSHISPDQIQILK